ncbi:MAG: hypothetical protein CM15mP12_4130 [Gammaproteobacteria bacterium]|nr:MAG: hypothetical protein CM15mP12_4130 [Gammaproteobacteria bacterium]
MLKGLEAVRTPWHVIGDTDDGTGLHHMVFEVLDNSIDESMAGYCSKILLKFNKNGSVTVQDDGRGIPVDKHKKRNCLQLNLLCPPFTRGKFDDNHIRCWWALGGRFSVNVLSSQLSLKVFGWRCV